MERSQLTLASLSFFSPATFIVAPSSEIVAIMELINSPSTLTFRRAKLPSDSVSLRFSSKLFVSSANIEHWMCQILRDPIGIWTIGRGIQFQSIQVLTVSSMVGAKLVEKIVDFLMVFFTPLPVHKDQLLCPRILFEMIPWLLFASISLCCFKLSV